VSFSVSMIFSFLAIFQVLQWTFLIWSFFIFPRHISCSKGCISYILHFQVSCHLRGPTVYIYHFSYFSIFLGIFNYLKSVIPIFCVFQFSCHIPCLTVCISHFSSFPVISSFFKSSTVFFWYSMIFSFLAIFHVLQRTFPFSSFFSFPRHISHPTVCVSHFPHFQLSCHIPGPTVYISHFSRFSVISSFSWSWMCVSLFPWFSLFLP
jgi:hypothetical protein